MHEQNSGKVFSKNTNPGLLGKDALYFFIILGLQVTNIRSYLMKDFLYCLVRNTLLDILLIYMYPSACSCLLYGCIHADDDAMFQLHTNSGIEETGVGPQAWLNKAVEK